MNKTNEKQNVFIYCRALPQEASPEISLARQEAICRETCHTWGVDVMQVFSDKGCPDAPWDRWGLAELLAYAEYFQEWVFAIVVAHPEALSQVTAEFSIIKKRLKALGIDVICCSDGNQMPDSVVEAILRGISSQAADNGHEG